MEIGEKDGDEMSGGLNLITSKEINDEKMMFTEERKC